MESTSNLPALEGHRDLVDQRWQLVSAFSNGSQSDSVLSPESQKLRKELFRKEGPLNELSLKSYKKRFTAYMQRLSNASERLNAVQKEEVEEGDVGDFNATTTIVCMQSLHMSIILILLSIHIHM